MNEFYHAFTVGFNWWFIVGPLMMLIMALLGSTRYVLNEATMRIQRRGKGFDVLLKIITTVMDVVLHALIIKESLVGLFQWLVNRVDGDPVWAFILLPLALTFTFLAVYCAFFTMGRIGEWASHGYLLDLKRNMIAEEKKAAKKYHREMRIVTLAKEDPEGPIEKVEAEIVDDGWQPGRQRNFEADYYYDQSDEEAGYAQGFFNGYNYNQATY